MDNANAKLIDTLRRAAGFLEANPAIPRVYEALEFNAFAATPDEFSRMAALIPNGRQRISAAYFTVEARMDGFVVSANISKGKAFGQHADEWPDTLQTPEEAPVPDVPF